MDEEFDPREIDLSKPEHFDHMKKKIQKWIYKSDNELKDMVDEYDENETFYEEQYAPQGFTNDPTATIKRTSKQTGAAAPESLPDTDAELYMQPNEIKIIVDSTEGEYGNSKKSISASPKNPRDTVIASICAQAVEDHERESRAWEEVRKPGIHSMLINGLGFSDIFYNPRKNLPLGKIEFEFVSPRDVLMDIHCKKLYFDDSEYRIRIKRYEVKRAKKFVKRIAKMKGGIPVEEDRVLPDTEYDLNYPDTSQETKEADKFVTFYFGQYKETFDEPYDDKGANLGDEGSSSMSQGNQDQKPGNEQGNEDEVIAEQETDYLFDFIYNNSLGCIFHAKNKYGMWNLKPYYRKKSEKQLYPRGDVYFLKNLQVYYGMLNTLILKHARNMVNEVFEFDETKFKKYADLVNQALATGGVIPKVDKEGIHRVERGVLPTEIITLLDRTKKYLEDAGYRHDVQKGSYPGDKRMPYKALQLLNVQARQTLGDIDMNISWVASREAEHILKIMATEYRTASWVKVQDASSGTDKHFKPIQTAMTLQEYIKYLMDNNLAMDKFESENVVHFMTLKGSEFNPVNPGSALDYTMVIINPLDKDLDLRLEVKLDFDAEKNKNREEQKDMFVFSKGLMAPDMFLRRQGYKDVDEMLRRAMEFNQAMKMGTEIMKLGPQFVGIVQKLMEQAAQKRNPVNSGVTT